jgi:hypothetical protein
MAALLLIVLAATLALLARPSPASALDSYDVHATVRYGCAADTGEDNFVEVGLRVEKWKDDDEELVLQVGLAGPGSTDTEIFPEGGPSLVTLGRTPTKVRLAGPVHDGDHVFLRQLDQPGVITLPLKATCHRIKPTNFGLDSPTVQVATRSCSPGAQANLKVTLANPNEVDRRLEKMGIEQIDYTVLLVGNDGTLAGSEPVGTLVSFDEPSASVITLSQVVPKPALYQVRVIGLDGAVVSSGNIRLSCASTGGPGSSSPTRPTPSVPSSPSKPGSPSTSRPAPSTSHPAPSTPAHTPTGASHRPPPASSAASTPAPSSTPSAVPTRSTPVQGVTSTPAPRPSATATATSSSRAGQPVPGTGTPSTRPSPTGTDSAAPTTSGPAPSPSASSTVIQLVEPRSGYRGVPVFQKDMALVLLAFCTGMVALVGSSVVAARRR